MRNNAAVVIVKVKNSKHSSNFPFIENICVDGVGLMPNFVKCPWMVWKIIIFSATLEIVFPSTRYLKFDNWNYSIRQAANQYWFFDIGIVVESKWAWKIQKWIWKFDQLMNGSLCIIKTYWFHCFRRIFFSHKRLTFIFCLWQIVTVLVHLLIWNCEKIFLTLYSIYMSQPEITVKVRTDSVVSFSRYIAVNQCLSIKMVEFTDKGEEVKKLIIKSIIGAPNFRCCWKFHWLFLSK